MSQAALQMFSLISACKLLFNIDQLCSWHMHKTATLNT